MSEDHNRDQLPNELAQGLAPTGGVENILTNEMARRAAGMQWWGNATTAQA